MTQIADVNQVVYDYLTTNLPGVALYAGVNYPAADWKPADGPAVAFSVRGGLDTEERDYLLPSFQFKVYGTDPLDAWGTYQSLDAALVRPAADVNLMGAVMESIGQPVVDTDSNWDYVLAHYIIFVRNS